MRFLIKALLAATALIPVAAAAQDAPEREGRWRGNRGELAEAKIEARNEARGIEAPPALEPQPQLQAAPRSDGNRGPRGDGAAEFRPQPRAEQSRPDQPRAEQFRSEQRWGGDRGVNVGARADTGAEFRRGPDGGGRRWDRGSEARTELPQANVAVSRPGGPDWQSPGADRARTYGRSENRPSWSSQQGDGRDGRRFDGRNDGRPQSWDRQRDERDGWNRFNRDNRFDNGGWNRQRADRFDDNRWAQPRSDDRFQYGGAWNRTWRNDQRYDWSGYRASNRYAYRLPRYYAPSNWSYGYRRFSIGATLSSVLWDENYWIEDPYTYRLPEVYGPYRWVRYYDDALLVDIRTGRVVDVVNGIFW